MSAKEQAGVAQRLQSLTPAQRALLERRLMARRAEAARQATIAPRALHSPTVLSRSQELLWLLSQVFNDGIAYNAPGAFHLQGPLDVELLQRSLEALTERHEILRTTYVVIDGQPMQEIGPARPVVCNVVDLREHPRDEREAQAQRILKEESGFPFDLVNGPVMRTTVIHCPPTEHVLMVNLHHIATDGYSRTALFRDLSALYDAFARGEEPRAPAAADPVRRLRGVAAATGLTTGVADAQLDYWQAQAAGRALAPGPPHRLPAPAGALLGGRPHEHDARHGDPRGRSPASRAGRTPRCSWRCSPVRHAARALLRPGRRRDRHAVCGAQPDRARLDGRLLHQPARPARRPVGRPAPSASCSHARARRRSRPSQHADVPYETIVRATNPERDLSQTPVFQAMIVLPQPGLADERPKFEPAGIRCTEITHEKGWSKFDVLLGMSERTHRAQHDLGVQHRAVRAGRPCSA